MRVRFSLPAHMKRSRLVIHIIVSLLLLAIFLLTHFYTISPEQVPDQGPEKNNDDETYAIKNYLDKTARPLYLSTIEDYENKRMDIYENKKTGLRFGHSDSCIVEKENEVDIFFNDCDDWGGWHDKILVFPYDKKQTVEEAIRTIAGITNQPDCRIDIKEVDLSMYAEYKKQPKVLDYRIRYQNPEYTDVSFFDDPRYAHVLNACNADYSSDVNYNRSFIFSPQRPNNIYFIVRGQSVEDHEITLEIFPE
jgi:hypothetical protein